MTVERMPYLSIVAPTARGTVSHVARDPFARGEYHRETVGDHGPCRWCGREARVLFRYGWESDGLATCPPRLHDGAFCSLPCFTAYVS